MKITDSPIVSSVNTTDNVMLNQGSSLKQVQVQKIVDLSSSASLNAAKGAILPYEMDNIFIIEDIIVSIVSNKNVLQQECDF